MKHCHLCQKPFESLESSADPALQAGIHLAKTRYADLETTCADCLASRGRLAMMYDPEVFD